MKLLIVDDEDYTREGLVESLPWKEYGIEEIMQARDGKVGLTIAHWFKPDIVLSDIRMPKLNGIEFARELNEINPQTKIIFMSGYMEIDYLKSAIQLSAVDYLEKPIDLEVLKAAVQKAALSIKAQLQAQMLTADRKELQQQKLVNTLVCKDIDRKMLYRLCKEVGFPITQNYICFIIQNKKKSTGTEAEQNGILNFLGGNWRKTLCNYMGEGKYCVILAYEKKDSFRLSALYLKMADKFKDFVLGIGFESGDVMNIYNSYQTALLAINCAFYDEEEQIFMIDEEILRKQGLEPGIYGEFMQVLAEEPLKLKDWFEALFSDLKKQKYYGKEKVQALLASFVTSMVDRYPDLMDYLDGIRSRKEIEQRISHFQTLDQIQEFISTLLKKLEVLWKNQSKYSRITRGVMDYIANHYSESDLSITQIAEQFHFSATYLNVLFKQEMQVNLKQFLSDYRIEKAKNMLEKDYYKITEIAELCGYANANYFAKVFKEETYLTPLEYRKRRAE
ncbi:response regulator [Anaerocolumna jejuensis]|uniref:response regulator n=1 Tax=Anaerocolumna jejuensis TaxID=259063 RepID=UPI003F7C46CB